MASIYIHNYIQYIYLSFITNTKLIDSLYGHNIIGDHKVF